MKAGVPSLRGALKIGATHPSSATAVGCWYVKITTYLLFGISLVAPIHLLLACP